MQGQALVLLLGLLVTSSVANWYDECQELQQEWKNSGAEIPYSEEALGMAILWNSELGHAGAALLRATLLAAGYRADYIRLYHRYSDDLPPEDTDLLMINVMMTAQLQFRLTPHAARISACKDASIWPLNESMVHICDFILQGEENPGFVNIYIMNQWKSTCAAEFIRQTIANSSIVRITNVDHTDLADRIQNSNNSFFFLDTDSYYRTNTTHVYNIRLPPPYVNCSSFFENVVFLKYAKDVLPESFIVFSPTLDNLYNVMFQLKNVSNMETAACRWALEGDEQFTHWRVSALKEPRRGLVLLMICQSETPETYEKLREMTTLIDEYSNNTVLTYLDKKSINIKVAYYDCPNINLLLKTSIIMFQENRIPNLEGIIMPENLAAALAPYAALLQVPLLTYDVNSGSMVEPAVRSATGNVKHLKRALRRFLADCGWQRLAIISEPTHLAKTLSAALRTPTTQLAIREVNVTWSSNITSVLRTLIDVDARIFLINTAAPLAARILAAGQTLNITRDNGFSWIVREYDMADNATAVTKPYSVSFWWRGNSNNETRNKGNKDKKNDGKANGNNMKYNVELREKLEKKWHGRAWPLHAAPILDALLTFKDAINLFKNNISWSWPRVKKMSSIWNYIQAQPTPGIYETLTYDEEGIIGPSVFVEQWGTEPRPRLLATWRGGEWRQASEKCPAIDPWSHDGSQFCLISSGDPFQPKCWDAIWIPSTILVILVGTALVITAIYFSRKILNDRDRRIKTDFAKRLLARRERVFEALADNLIERSALKLLQEVGTGRFGRVHLGLLREAGSKHQNIVVAAKALKEEASSAEESEFLREACTLATLHHEHIIRFLGVCVVDGPPLLLMEHAFFGDLLHYLKARRYLAEGPADADSTDWFKMNEKAHVSAKSLTKLAQEAASALAYLAQRGIVHRDLRASNCLVDERRCLKLADFGLARATGTIDGEYACRRGFFPVLWMAPESLAKGVSSAASDVWSFGVLVFELVTLGRRPYGEQPPSIVMRHVLDGGRPWLPWDASEETRALTRACWRREPEARPTAARLADWLSTRWRALRPALVAELIDIDNKIFAKKNSIDIDYLDPENSSNQTVTVQQSSDILP